jgi:hypothetical protein
MNINSKAPNCMRMVSRGPCLILILQEYKYSPPLSAVPFYDTLDNSPIPNDASQSNRSAAPNHDASSRISYVNGIGLGIKLDQDSSLPQHLESPESTRWLEKIEKDANAKISKY